MKPLRLELRAFGSYADEELIDFSALNGRSFFLIHGPTGAGKTTIFDGMCFALFGASSGKDREGRHMRSDYAAPETPTEVTFDFKLGGDVYRVTRRPPQQRPRRRGTGFRAESPKGTLWKRVSGAADDEGWSVLATQWSRVTEKIEGLVGFRADQFRQVVMLPQGQFRRLLTAASREREEIFEALFQTSAYRRIEEALKGYARSTAEAMEGLDREERAHLAQQGAEDEVALRRALIFHAQRSKLVRARLRSQRAQRKRDEQAVAKAKLQLQRFEEKAAAEREHSELERNRGRFDAMRSELASARRAAPLVELESHVQHSVREVSDAQRRLLDAERSLEVAQRARVSAQTAVEGENSRASQLNKLRERLVDRKRLLPIVRGLDADRKSFEKAEKQSRRLEATHNRDSADLEECRSSIESAQHRLNETQREVLLLDSRKKDEAELGQAVDCWNRLEACVGKIAQAAAKLETLRTEESEAVRGHEAACAALERAESAWVAEQAGVLAAALRTGERCPVCGSREHPEAARSEGARLSEAKLDVLRGDAKRTNKRRERLRENVTKADRTAHDLTAERRALKERLGARTTSKEELLVELDRTRTTRELSENAARELVASRAATERLVAKEKALVKRLAELADELSDARKTRERLQAVLQERVADVPVALRNIDTLQRAIDAASRALRAREAAHESANRRFNTANAALAAAQTATDQHRQVLNKAIERRDTVTSTFLRRLEAGGFSSDEQFQSAKRGDDAIQELESCLDGFNVRLEAAKTRLERASQTVAADDTRPDLDQLQAGLESTTSHLDVLVHVEAALNAEVDQLMKTLDAINVTRCRRAQLDEEYRVFGRLAEVANGQNRLGLTFQRFVLASFLDDVLIAATERLSLMSRGRFSLHRVRDRDDRRKAGGLDLEVYDTYTGTTRPVATLSGGESFLASLALALGLADVVQAHAGGVHLETLFVDEGFGNLDPEALDLALRAFMDLEKGGRLVGIISHVPELRERIDARLEVLPQRRGSVTRFVVAS